MDAVVVEAVRSPMCLAAGGSLCGISPMELVRQTVDALLQRAGVDAADVDRLLIQCGSEVIDRLLTPIWHSWPVHEFPARIPAITMQRWCGTGQQAVQEAARVVRSSSAVAVVIGVESASRGGAEGDGGSATTVTAPGQDLAPVFQRVLAAELLAAKWAIDRERLDEYAIRSHQRATAVSASGEFNKEIVPIYTPGDDAAAGRLAVCDETIDSCLTVEQLRELKPTFFDAVITQPPEVSWSITAGNSAPRAVGTSAVLLMSKLRAAQLGVRPRARLCSFSVATGDPSMPLAAPLRATEKVLAGAKKTLAQLDHVEVDEEFACVPLAWSMEFSVSPHIFNPRGGALALGSPRACGALRQITTMLSALEATGGRFGLQTMSAKTGTAHALLIERC